MSPEQLRICFARLLPDQILSLQKSDISLPQYEIVKLSLDCEVLPIEQNGMIVFKKLKPADDFGYPGVTYIIPTYDGSTYFENTAWASPDIHDPKNEVIVLKNQSSPKPLFELAHAKSTKRWIVYMHHDAYIPKGWGHKFWKEVSLAEKKFGDIGVAGVFGITGNRRTQRVEAGAIIDQDGTRVLVGQLALPAKVRTVDACIMAVKNTPVLIPNERLGWHFYDADLCIKAKNAGLSVVAIEAWALHRSVWQQPDAFFLKSKEIFKEIWKSELPFEVPCDLVE